MAELVLQYRWKNNIPQWLGWLCMLVAFVSSFHHMRPYDQEYDDILRLVDVVVANSFGAALFVLFYNSIVQWVGLAVVIVILIGLAKLPHPNSKSFMHMWFHLTVCALTIYQVFKVPGSAEFATNKVHRND